MFARAALVTMSLAWIGCYDVPQPACGFVCGPQGECPRSYTCNTADQRCHLDGTSPTQACPGPDAGPDADNTPPFVSSHDPLDQATNVSPTINITAAFSEPVVGVDDTSIVVTVNAVPITGSVTYLAGPPQVIYDPDPVLPLSGTVTVSIQANPMNPAYIKDLSGNPLTPATWQFTVAADTTAPAVTSTVPLDLAMGVATTATIDVQFTEPVTGVTTTSFAVDSGGPIAGTLASTMGGARWTFTPTAPLPSAATISVTLSTAITDLAVAPNALAAPYLFSFGTL